MLRQSGIFRANEARRRTGDGLHRPRAGAGHHDHGEEHRRRSTGASRSTSSTRPVTPTSAARWSGRSRWSTACCCSSTPPRARCRRPASCSRKPSSADLPPHPRHQQDRPARRPDPGGPQRGLRPLHRPRRHRGPARLSRHLHQRPGGHRQLSLEDEAGRTCSPSSTRSSAHVPPPTGDPTGAAPVPGDQPRLQRLRRAAGHRPGLRGTLRAGRRRLPRAGPTGRPRRRKVTLLYGFEGLEPHRDPGGDRGRHRGDGGDRGVTIGDTISDPENPEALPRIAVDEPTIVDGLLDQHLALRREGREVRHLAATPRAAREGAARQRLDPGRLSDDPTAFTVMGRGELQLAILIEMMRREGLRALGRPGPRCVTKT